MKIRGLCLYSILILATGCAHLEAKRNDPMAEETFTLHAIGTVQREGDRTYIVLEKEYAPGLMGLDQFSHVTVVYWFHLNDTPEKRAVFQVHPQGNTANPMRGVFCHSFASASEPDCDQSVQGSVCQRQRGRDRQY